MRKTFFLALAASLLLCSCSGKVEKGESLLGYVDPQIGTAHSRWFFYTPAAVPFGMAKVAPTTDGPLGNEGGWQAVGYDARHTSIEGFACFHEFQVGGVVLAPTTGPVKTVPGELDDPDSGWRSRFDKADEHSSPGYYKVLLKDYGITAELTATKRVAFHRYTFPESKGNVIFEVGSRMGESGPVKEFKVDYKDGRVEGYVVTEPVYVDIYQKGGTVNMYFSALMSCTPSSYEKFDKGMYFTFDDIKAPVEIKVGLSYTSVGNARANLKAEAENISFDKAKKLAEAQWEENLGRIRVEGGKREDRVKFYTGLFHALLGRGLASDVNGAYPANDGSVGQIPLSPDGKPLHNHYNTDAIWGGYWNLTQLWTLAWPEYYSDWISSQLLVYKDAGWLGDGIACSRYVSGVGTNFVPLAIAAAYNCGIRDFDTSLAYEAARKDVLGYEGRIAGAGKMDNRQFVTRGYVPYNKQPWSTDTLGSAYGTSHTLEYAFNAYAVSRFAKALGKEGDIKELERLSEGWKLVFDPEKKLMRPKLEDGSWYSPFDPFAPWVGFQEGNAVQYTYYVPHAVKELIALIGEDEFNARLDSTFTISRKSVFGGGETVDAFSGLSSQYNHGNQPSLHISALFNFSGKPYLSQKWMKIICDEFYGTEGVHGYGYGQDEDQGQLGAWYVMASMGLFDVRGLTSPDPSFQVMGPLFDKVTITQNPKYGGAKFTVLREGEGMYIRELSLNGKVLDSIQLPLSDIRKGGTLKVVMSTEPNVNLSK